MTPLGMILDRQPSKHTQINRHAYTGMWGAGDRQRHVQSHTHRHTESDRERGRVTNKHIQNFNTPMDMHLKKV